MSTGLAASTVTPGMTAPDASFATPASDACAKAVVAMRETPTNTSSIRTTTRMHSSCCRPHSHRAASRLRSLEFLHHGTDLPRGGPGAIVELLHQGGG